MKKKVLSKGMAGTAVVLSLTAFGLVSTSPAAEAATTTSRLAGATRFGTSVEISKKAFPNGANTVYIARGDVLADALAGGSLTNGPVLLVPGTTVPTETLAEINRLNPTRVIALGGNDVVSDAVLKQAAGTRPSSRLAGTDRYGTAVAISQHQFPKGASRAFVANGIGLADAVSAGSLTGGPILPNPPVGKGLSLSVMKEVTRLAPNTLTALGDKGVVSDEAMSVLKDRAGTNPAVTRIGGATRYDTSAAIAQAAFPNGASTVYLANGTVFADAVSGGALTDGPVLLVNDKADLTKALQLVNKWKPTNIIALGGKNVVSDATLARFQQAVDLPAGWTSEEYQILLLTNGERAKAGLKALQPQTCLHTIARDWSNYMMNADVFEHGDFGARLDKCYTNSYGGENIAMGYSSPEAFVAGWMNSPGHKANILNPNFEYLGVGMSSDKQYATQDFSSHNY